MYVQMLEKTSRGLAWGWVGALSLFVVAACTGMAYRFILAYGVAGGLNLTNVRHAHSHLMYFGWVTPGLIALIGLTCSDARRDRKQLAWIVAGCLVAAVVAYPLFLLFGYSLVPVGDGQMPIAVMGSTLNMMPWIAFIVWYVLRNRGRQRSTAHMLWDASLVFLALSMVGAGMLALLKPLGIQSDVWSAALTHVFLDYFSEGWFVLGVLGLAHSSMHPNRNQSSPEGLWFKRGLFLICMGLPLTFALGMPSFLLPSALQWVARVGGLLLSVGLLVHVALLWSDARGSRGWWRIPLMLLALKTVGQLVGAVSPGVWWSDLHGMRILYLHLMLLGFVSLGLVAAAENRWGRRATAGRGLLALAVGVVLLSLLPLSAIWPAALGGRWTYVLAAWVSLLPILAVLRMMGGAMFTGRRGSRGTGARAGDDASYPLAEEAMRPAAMQ